MNNKGRLTNAERDKKKLDAKSLFCKGLSFQSISTIIGISTDTLKNWSKEQNWEEEKELYNITPNSLRKMVLELVRDMKAGNESNYSADEISKLASAFDKLGDKDKKTAYAMSTFDDFSDWLLLQIPKQKPKEQPALIELAQTIRNYQERYIQELLMKD